jgi:hypothetical protein
MVNQTRVGQAVGLGRDRKFIWICRVCGRKLTDPYVCPEGCRIEESKYAGRVFTRNIGGRLEKIRRETRQEL